MQNHKRIAAALLLTMLFAGSLFAKTQERRLEGTVKTIGQNSVTIETKSGQTQTIKITSATKFFKGKKPGSLSEMKTGDHAVFKVIASKSSTTTNPSADQTAMTTTDTHKDTLSLGLSFSATQVAY